MGRTQRRAQLLGSAGAGAALLLAVGLTVAAWQTWPGGSTVTVAEALGALATGIAALVAWWICGVLGLAVVAVRDEGGPLAGPPADRRLPRRVAAWLLAVAAATGTVAPASAAPAPIVATATATGSASQGTILARAGSLDLAGPIAAPGQVRAATATEEAVPEPGWTPTPPLPPPSDRRPPGDVSLVAATGGPHAGQADEPAVVVVRAGDTLWDIAARHLGPESTDQDVAEAWPRWYAANIDQIGADPDLILPGQRLLVPAGATS